jgi:predicted ester cyclase
MQDKSLSKKDFNMENKLLVRNYIEEIVNTGKVNGIEKYISSDYEEIHDGIRHKIGIQGAKDHILGVRKTYPDLSIKIDHQISEGEWVVTCITVTGTFKNKWLGMKPTGKEISYTGVNIDRVVDGLIVEHGGAANLLGPLLDAGVIESK